MDCPDDQILHQFLDEQLDHESFATLADHLEDCEDCQKRLDELVSIEDLEFQAKSSHDDSTADGTIEKLVKHLAATPPKQQEVEVSFSGRIIGDYQIGEVIGHGTTGVVYQAFDKQLKRNVALKILRSDFSSSERGRTRLEREAQAAAKIRHPNVVTLFDANIDPIGVSYLVLELVEGETLRQRLKRFGTFDSKLAAKLTLQILSGLSAAHQQGLVHRDLKSSNVLINTTGLDEGVMQLCKITDFGLVRDLESDSNLTRENLIAGTPAYMSPEQILLPHEVDHRADIYSAGVVLYEMLRGELPFRGVDKMVLQQVIHDDPQSLCRSNDTISRDLETICFKAMSKDRDRRYESATEMREDLERWLEGKPIHARRVGIIGQTWKWTTRNPAISLLLITLVCALGLIAIGSTVAAITIRSASLELEQHANAAKRQRDQSLETIRQLVFDINQLLEPENEVDLDEAQEKILQVALTGISRIEKTGSDAGILDVSLLAAKNRLGDVYFRLDRITEASEQFAEALKLADRLTITGEDQVFFLREKMRALEGLASFSMLNNQIETANARIAEADDVAASLSELTNEQVEPTYYFDDSFLLAEEEIAQLDQARTFAMDSPISSVGQVRDVTLKTQALVWHNMEVGESERAFELCQELDKWLKQDVASENVSPRLDRQLAFSQHEINYQMAELVDNESQYLQRLRLSIDVLPRNANGRFHPATPEDCFLALDDLIDTAETLAPADWMVPYFEDWVKVKRAEFLEFPTKRKRELAYCVSLAQLACLHAQLKDQANGEHVLEQLKAALNGVNLETVPNRLRSELDHYLGELKIIGIELN